MIHSIAGIAVLASLVYLVYAIISFRRWLDKYGREDSLGTRLRLGFLGMPIGPPERLKGPRGAHYDRVNRAEWLVAASLGFWYLTK